VFLKLWTNAARFDSGRGSLRTWLLSAVRNRSIDYLRGQAVDSLPLEQKQAVELAYFGGYSMPEIAEMIRVPHSTVKGRMRLGMEKLHSYLQGRGFVYD